MPVPGRPGLVGVGTTGPAAKVVDRLVGAALEVGEAVCREPDDRLGSEDAAGQGHGRVVLADVDAVGIELERKVGAIVEDERHAEISRGVADEPSDFAAMHLAGVEMLLPQLHDVDATCGCTSATK